MTWLSSGTSSTRTRLTGIGGWELALDRLMELQEAEDLLDGQLRQAEMVEGGMGTCGGPADRLSTGAHRESKGQTG